ncbi:MAG: glycoside hydrolase family 108 protein [Oligoflexales bacterium]|nr:glycoside hydrolase family 108 protein [Oligoflexales bacterium]
MITKSYKRALDFVLKWEGGFSNHPDDPGGVTNCGVTQKTYDIYRKKIKKSLQSVKKISPLEIVDVYDELFWDKIRGDDLKEDVAIALFDWAVNTGVKRAIRHLQLALLVKEDGVMGPITLKAANECSKNQLKMFLNIRERFYKKQNKPMFLRGWLNRLNALRDYLGLA